MSLSAKQDVTLDQQQDTFEITYLGKEGGPLTKRIHLSDGELVSDGSACVMSRGVAGRHKVNNMHELSSCLTEMKSNEALALGAMRDGLPDRVDIVTSDQITENTPNDVIARTANNFIYRAKRAALVLVDFDLKGMPAAVAKNLETRGGFLEAILQIIPEFDGTGYLWRASTSAGFSRSDTGEKFPASGGLHLYHGVSDGSDIDRYLRTLHDHCWLNGLGWYYIGAAGHFLERSIIDRMVASGERLVFEGPPIYEYPLVQDAEARMPIFVEGGLYDTSRLTPLTEVEENRLSKMQDREKAERAVASLEKRVNFIATHARELASRTGMSMAKAERIITQQCEHVLYGDIVLPFDDTRHAGVTVADVLADPRRYVGQTMADPIEGVSYGRGKAKILKDRDSGKPYIHSFAHGDASYVLRLVDDQDLPIIIVDHSEMQHATDAGMEALVQANAPIYQRQSELVHVDEIPAKSADNKSIHVPAIRHVHRPLLRRRLNESANWQTRDKRGNLLKIYPPPEVVELLMDMPIWTWRYNELAGIISTPTMRRDGTILDKPGYDRETGLVLFNPPPMPTIPDNPTKDDAIKSLEILDELLVEVPFIDGPSKSVALSEIMTPVLRAMFLVVPLHLIKANRGGSGKTWLNHLAAIIALGTFCPIIKHSKDPREMDKQLSAVVLNGTPIFSIDNYDGLLSNESLCQLISEPSVTIRIFGSNTDQRVVRNNFTPFANGNNIAVEGALVRRTLQSTIDPQLERPETRVFRCNPLQDVLWDRGKYIAAILTMARAYIVAGMPDKPAPLAGFAEWSDLVRGSLMWLGCSDPLRTMEELSNTDPKKQEQVAVFRAIANLAWGKKTFTTAELVAETMGIKADPLLRLALINVAAKDGVGDEVCPRRLGKWFSRADNQIADNYKLIRNKSEAKLALWSLIRVETPD